MICRNQEGHLRRNLHQIIFYKADLVKFNFSPSNMLALILKKEYSCMEMISCNTKESCALLNDRFPQMPRKRSTFLFVISWIHGFAFLVCLILVFLLLTCNCSVMQQIIEHRIPILIPLISRGVLLFLWSVWIISLVIGFPKCQAIGVSSVCDWLGNWVFISCLSEFLQASLFTCDLSCYAANYRTSNSSYSCSFN